MTATPDLYSLPVERCNWCDSPAEYVYAWHRTDPEAVLAYACAEHKETPAALWPHSVADGEPTP